jgi:NADH-quinone oxidoreductase subunit H
MSRIVSNQVQGGNYWHFFLQPVGFIVFFVCALAECNRTPFDLPEAENELNFGYHQEYSSMKLGFYLFSEYINMFISSAVMATLFFGGYDILPFVDETKWGLSPNMLTILGFVALMAKTFFFLFVFIWIRWTVPRFRYDQLMNLGWKKLIPLALINMLVTAAVVLWLKK